METGSVTERLRAVFDTNVFISALLSRNPASPTKELLRRWRNKEFVLIVCELQMSELSNKLVDFDFDDDDIRELLVGIEKDSERVEVTSAPLPSLIPADPDDDAIIACAVAAKADYLVTYDPHFEVLGGEYEGVNIVKALPFLWAVRGDQPPEA